MAALGEVATLVVALQLKDQLSGGVAKVSSSLGTLEKRAGGLTGAAGRLGGALGHAGGQIAGLAASLGVLGGVGALAGVGALLKSSTDKATEFGAEVRRLMALSGQSAESMSTLAAGLEHFGIGADVAQRSIGFLEKNVGLLAAKKDGIATFEKTWSLSLTDANGKVKDANALILTTADYYNDKLIPASEKAAALSKLYGRSWQDMIPVLSAGRAQLQAAEEEAAKLGMTLTGQNMTDLVKLRDATRQWGDALGGLQLQIGLAVVPALTELTSAASKFVGENRQGIVAGFKSLLDVAGQIGGAIKDYVIPGISAIGKAWNTLPGPLRQLLIGGFVANKAAGWLFGTSPLSLVIKGLGGSLLQRGGTPANPLFVADVTGGLGKGLPGGALGGAVGNGGAMLAGGAAIAGAALSAGAVAAVGYVALDQYQQVATQAKGIAAQAAEFVKTATLADIRTAREAVITGAKQLADQSWNPMTGAATEDLGRAYKTLTDAMNAKAAEVARPSSGASMPINAATGFSTPARQLSAQIMAALNSRVAGALAGGVGRADALVSVFMNSTAPSLKSMNSALGQLKTMQARYLAQGDTKLAAAIGADLKTLQARVDAVTAAVNAKTFTAVINAQTGFTTGTTPIVKPGAAAKVNAATGFTISVQTSARQNTHATVVQSRYGPTPSLAGAQ